MAVPSIYSTIGQIGSPGAIEQTEAGIQRGTQMASTDWSTAQRRLGSQFSQRQLPRLQSSIAASGQWSSSNRKRDEGFLTEDFYEAGHDLNNAFQRQLGDFDQQRIYAALGAII